MNKTIVKKNTCVNLSNIRLGIDLWLNIHAIAVGCVDAVCVFSGNDNSILCILYWA